MRGTIIKNMAGRVVTPLLFVAVTTAISLLLTIFTVRVEWQQELEELVEQESYIISPFDQLFREVGEEFNVDWCLLSAIARVESEFNPKAISRSGAVGLMQIMPRVAQNMGVHRDSLFNPRVCTAVAAQLLHENKKMLKLGRDFDVEEHLKFVLACYNAGYLRVSDARRLARFYQDEYDDWYTVSGYLELLGEEEYYTHEVVKGGAFHGSEETIAYVKKVVRIYNSYLRKVARHERYMEQEQEG